jgi:hypothetical protein
VFLFPNFPPSKKVEKWQIFAEKHISHTGKVFAQIWTIVDILVYAQSVHYVGKSTFE